MNKNHKLSSSINVENYLLLEQSKDVHGIAKFFLDRLAERFINPIESLEASKKNGFMIMANSCLLIETIESFWSDWPTTKNQSAKAFTQFLIRCKRFHLLNGYETLFYKNVRCGILHQGETTGGWLISRKGPLFEPQTLTINATKFHRAVGIEIRDYADLLCRKNWESIHWKNFRKKMTAICENTGP